MVLHAHGCGSFFRENVYQVCCKLRAPPVPLGAKHPEIYPPFHPYFRSGCFALTHARVLSGVLKSVSTKQNQIRSVPQHTLPAKECLLLFGAAHRLQKSKKHAILPAIWYLPTFSRKIEPHPNGLIHLIAGAENGTLLYTESICWQ